jgi:hypothetical protein
MWFFQALDTKNMVVYTDTTANDKQAFDYIKNIVVKSGHLWRISKT